MLTESEQHYLRETVNDTERSYAVDKAVPQLLEQQAERCAGATALRFGETEVTYGELNERANRLAHVLISRGIGVGQMVAVCLERSVESVISLLGIWKAGAAYLPLDIEQPASRLRLMLEDAEPSLVITTAELSERLELEDKPGREVVRLEAVEELLQQQPNHDPGCGVKSRDLAYVIYTSGSTGVPKGVLVEHGQLLNTLLGAQELYQFNAQDVVPCLSSFAFDISLLELLMPLLAGGKVLLINAREMLDPKSALEVLSQITFLHAIPAPMRRIAALLSAESNGSHNQLRAVMVGGDAVSPELVVELLAALPRARVYVCYGPTETTIFCAAYEVSKQEKVEHRMLGYPIANAALRLYDRNVHLVPEGVVGEVYIGGPSVSRGYQNSAELTAEKFVELEGERWYRSGDLGRRLPDGSIAFEGRADGQVKVRGYRIEVGEIEAALESHATVRAAAVAVKPDARGEARLIGYVVSEESATAQAEELRRYLGDRLPAYMVPVMIVVLESLPLTLLGKLDRKALPEVEQVRREYEAPRTATEEILCDIWSEVLKVERVGIRESFFELGGHSLLATQLMSRVRDAFTIELPLRSLFEKPTIAELAVVMEEILIAEISTLDGDEIPAEEVMTIGSGG